jgi:hypothetical protein
MMGTIKLMQETLAPEVPSQQRGVSALVLVEAEWTGYRADIPEDGSEPDRFGKLPLHKRGEGMGEGIHWNQVCSLNALRISDELDQ